MTWNSPTSNPIDIHIHIHIHIHQEEVEEEEEGMPLALVEFVAVFVRLESRQVTHGSDHNSHAFRHGHPRRHHAVANEEQEPTTPLLLDATTVAQLLY
jgi:hypothetical protein